MTVRPVTTSRKHKPAKPRKPKAIAKPTGETLPAAKRLGELIDEQRRVLSWAAANATAYTDGDVGDYAANSLREQLLHAIGMTMEMMALAERVGATSEAVAS